jgi:flagellar biosynthesis component FlhA
MSLVFWFLLLVVQNAAFTWVSRARNSGSYGYHAIASVFSNGVFFVSQFILIGLAVTPGMSPRQIAVLAAVYISGTCAGSILMHWISINWLEKGKRKVGA